MSNGTKRLKLTVDVSYDLGRTNSKTLVNQLLNQLLRAADHLADEGLLSGDTEADVTEWTSTVEEVS